MRNSVLSNGIPPTHPADCLSQSGNVILEFAIALGLMIIILVGIINYGLALQEHSVMIDAARMGARASAKMASRFNAGRWVCNPNDANQKSDVAIRTARAFMQRFGHDLNNFTFRVRPRQLGTDNGVQVIITRAAENRFMFYVTPGFASCASGVFRIECGDPPTSTWNVGDPEC